MYRFLFIIFFFGCFKIAFTQIKIQGVVTNSLTEPIAFCNVVLLTEKDSTFVAGGVTTNSGAFLLEPNSKQNYLLKVSFVGYKTSWQKILAAENQTVQKIVLIENTSELAAVKLTAKRPLIIQKPDRLIFNVENSSLSSDNTWGILEKTPGVISIGEKLTIRNAPASIYINGRKVHLPASDLQTFLKNYSGGNIKQIEVIPNPPSSFDAASGPVLNIVTSTNLIPGYKGSVYGNYSQSIFPKYTFGTNHFYKTKKLDMFLNYSFSPEKKFKNENSFINFINDEGQNFSTWVSDFNKTTRSSVHTFNAILDYSFQETDQLNFQVTTLLSPNKSFGIDATTKIFNAENKLDSLYTTDSYLENDMHNLAFDLGYSHHFKKKGTNLSTSFHFTDYSQRQNQEVATTYFDNTGNQLNSNYFFTKSEQKTQLYSAKLDFKTDFGTVKFTSGLKIGVVNSESELKFFGDESGFIIHNTSLSDLFLYEEKVFAGYVNFSKKWKKWSTKVGLRGENTDRSGSAVSSDESYERNYFELFPTAYISYQASENHRLSFDYGRKIERPDYEALNPFRYFINENNFKTGNPNLKAAISNNFNLSYQYKKAYNFNLYYRDNGKNVAAIVFQNNDNLTLNSLQMNMEESKSYGVDFFHGRSLKDWWYSQAYVSLFHEEETFLAMQSELQSVTNKIDAYYISFYNSFDFSKEGTFSGSMNLYYLSDFIQGSYQMHDIFNLSFGLLKKLWKDRVEVSLQVEDVFNSKAVKLYSEYLNQDNGFLSHPENRFVKFGVKFNFGNSNLSNNKRDNHTEERERL